MTASSNSAVRLVLEFCELQRRLVKRFLEDLQPKDLERFTDVKRTGNLRVGGQIWQYARHGAGVLFQSPSVVIDAHVGLALFPNGVDGWRLLQYLESMGVGTLTFEGEVVAGDDEGELERLLENMARAGILEEVFLQPPTRLFRPAQSVLVPFSANAVPS